MGKKTMYESFSLCSRMGSIWKIGRSSDRQNPSRGDARFFYVSFSRNNGFPAAERFHDFDRFSLFVSQNWCRSHRRVSVISFHPL